MCRLCEARAGAWQRDLRAAAVSVEPRRGAKAPDEREGPVDITARRRRVLGGMTGTEE